MCDLWRMLARVKLPRSGFHFTVVLRNGLMVPQVLELRIRHK